VTRRPDRTVPPELTASFDAGGNGTLSNRRCRPEGRVADPESCGGGGERDGEQEDVRHARVRVL
jgi:hypothetical protein